VLFLVVIVGWAPYRMAKKQFASEVIWREPATYTFQESGIQVHRPSASSDLKWTVITEVLETRTLFLLHIGKRSAIVLPKRVFTDAAQIQSWKQLLQSQLASGVIDGGLLGRWC